MMNWKGCERTRSGPNLRHFPGICLEVPMRIMKKLSESYRLSSGRNLSSGPPEYEAGVLTTRPRL
jgi:hypothetical protein